MMGFFREKENKKEQICDSLERKKKKYRTNLHRKDIILSRGKRRSISPHELDLNLSLAVTYEHDIV